MKNVTINDVIYGTLALHILFKEQDKNVEDAYGTIVRACGKALFVADEWTVKDVIDVIEDHEYNDAVRRALEILTPEIEECIEEIRSFISNIDHLRSIR